MTVDALAGPVRTPRNLAAGVAGSIHDDATATALGFRGGTVAGSIHMDQFPPLALQAFGRGWFEDGSLSLYFRHATTDGEPVRAFIERPSGERDVQTRAWATTTDDVVVAEGTAGRGHPAQTSALRARDLRPVDPAVLRILAGVKPGAILGDVRLQPDGERQRRRIAQDGVTEPLDWYTGPSPWGGPIAAPSTVVDLLYARLLDDTKASMGEHVGLFGAIEIRFQTGPVLLDSHYRVTGEVVAVSQTPKTEAMWFDSRAYDASGEVVADMRMMLRQLKLSSPLYQVQE
jgi:acyl dehydratase